MSEETLRILPICLSPAFWILFAFWTQRILMSKGYQRVESILIGLILGPLGVITAYLMPKSSRKIRSFLREFGTLFGADVFLVASVLAIGEGDVTLTSPIFLVVVIIIVLVWIQFAIRWTRKVKQDKERQE